MEHANDFHKALLADGIYSELFKTTESHGDMMTNMGEPWSEVTPWVLDFLTRKAL